MEWHSHLDEAHGPPVGWRTACLIFGVNSTEYTESVATRTAYTLAKRFTLQLIISKWTFV
jgi:hypothetical protein